MWGKKLQVVQNFSKITVRMEPKIENTGKEEDIISDARYCDILIVIQ